MKDSRAAGGSPVHVFRDARGALTLAELDSLPFPCQRVYVLHDVPVGKTRAGHASRTQHRYIVIARGRALLTVDDGRRSECVELAPGDGVHVPPGTWNEIEALEEGLVALVCASGAYDPVDYVRDRSELPVAAASALQT